MIQYKKKESNGLSNIRGQIQGRSGIALAREKKWMAGALVLVQAILDSSVTGSSSTCGTLAGTDQNDTTAEGYIDQGV
jgi:hypothetical protein